MNHIGLIVQLGEREKDGNQRAATVPFTGAGGERGVVNV